MNAPLRIASLEPVPEAVPRPLRQPLARRTRPAATIGGSKRPLPSREQAAPSGNPERPHLRVLGVRPAAGAAALPPSAMLDLTVLPSAAVLRQWVDAAAPDTLRFVDCPNAALGDFADTEREWFREDHACLSAAAESLGAALGLSPATCYAAEEKDRCVSYWPLAEGFAGVCAPGSVSLPRLLGIK